MTDHFAVLGLPPSAWVDPAAVKARHHELVGAAHPDKPGGDAPRAAALNEARRVLSNHALRLRHLAALLPQSTSATDPHKPDWDLFSRIGALANRAADLARTKSGASSRIARTVATLEAERCTSALRDMLAELEQLSNDLESRTRKASVEDRPGLEQLAAEWTFLGRSTRSLREALTALSL
jgi:curved DNA-binding protein CbpA